MNNRQSKKKIYHKAMPHGFWKEYKVKERGWVQMAASTAHKTRKLLGKPSKMRIKTLMRIKNSAK